MYLYIRPFSPHPAQRHSRPFIYPAPHHRQQNPVNKNPPIIFFRKKIEPTKHHKYKLYKLCKNTFSNQNTDTPTPPRYQNNKC